MSFTVITVALNAADLLPATIESVLGQDFGDIQYIVADGHSWDDTPDVLARYRGEVDETLEVFDGGVFHAMNHALERARGTYVLFMNAGDRLYAAHTLSAIWERRIGDPDIVHGDHILQDGAAGRWTPSCDYGALHRRLVAGEVSPAWLAALPAHQATFTRTALLQARGGYDTAYEVCADHAFLLAAHAAGASIQYVDEIVAIYAAGGLSMQRAERCRLEWAALYRGVSRAPEAVDRFFCGATPPRRAADTVPAALPDAGGLVRAKALRLAVPGAPGEGAAVGLALRGVAGRAGPLEARVDGRTVGAATLPEGAFAADIVFDAPLDEGTAVDLVALSGPPRGAPEDTDGAGRVAALSEVRFVLAREVLPRLDAGVTAFGAGAGGVALLAEGWAAPEAGHVWSVARRAALAFSARTGAARLVLTVRGNPFADADQTLTLTLNGTVLHAAPLAPDAAAQTVTLVPGAAWRRGANRLELAVSALAQPPGDPRTLGLALEELALEAPEAADGAGGSL